MQFHVNITCYILLSLGQGIAYYFPYIKLCNIFTCILPAYTLFIVVVFLTQDWNSYYNVSTFVVYFLVKKSQNAVHLSFPLGSYILCGQ